MEWLQFMLQLIGVLVLMNENQYSIKGLGIEVEIDESKFGKHKYHRGHHVDGVCIFGSIK